MFEYFLPRVVQFRDAIVTIIYDEFKEPEKSLDLLSNSISEMQEALRNGADSCAPGGLGESVEQVGESAPIAPESVTVEAAVVKVESESANEDQSQDSSDELFSGVDFSQDQDLYQGFIAESNEHLDIALGGGALEVMPVKPFLGRKRPMLKA